MQHNLTPNEASLPISFQLLRVITNQFAILIDEAPSATGLELQTGIRFMADDKGKSIAAFTRFSFLNKGVLFMVVEGGCIFKILEESWASMLDRNGSTLNASHGFLAHLTMLAVGTTRGILHAKTENTPFNQFLIPTINVAQMVKEDIKFSFGDIQSDV